MAWLVSGSPSEPNPRTGGPSGCLICSSCLRQEPGRRAAGRAWQSPRPASDQALAWSTEQVADPLRRQADAAWKARDWPNVIEQLQATGVPLKESGIK